MDDYNIMISGLTREYPEYKYSTNQMIDLLGNKLTDNVKENIVQLGVENRFFIRPFERYIQSDGKRIKTDSDGEPISDLCTKTAEKCLQNLGLNKNDITCVVAAFEDNDFLSPWIIFYSSYQIGIIKISPSLQYSRNGMFHTSKIIRIRKKFNS